MKEVNSKKSRFKIKHRNNGIKTETNGTFIIITSMVIKWKKHLTAKKR